MTLMGFFLGRPDFRANPETFLKFLTCHLCQSFCWCDFKLSPGLENLCQQPMDGMGPNHCQETTKPLTQILLTPASWHQGVQNPIDGCFMSFPF